MEFNRRLYRDNPLHLYSYQIDKETFKLVIINVNKGNVSSITISYQDRDYEFDLKTSDPVIELEDNIISNSFVNEVPFIKKAVIEDREIVFEYSKNYLYLLQPKSIANMRDEKYLYIQKMVKYNGCKKENVKCCADQFKDYWHCTCGSVNLNCQDECISCHINKELLFSHEIDNSVEEVKSRRIVRSNIYILWLGLILLFIQFAIVDVMLGGDLFFSNSDLNSFLAVVNRVVVPVVLTVLTISLIFARRRYLLKLEMGLDIARIVCVIYLGVIVNISFVRHSYAFVFFVGFNLVLIGLYVAHIILYIKRTYQVVSIALMSCLLISGVIQAGYFSKIDMSVSKEGVTLVIHENEKELYIQKEIDNVEIYKAVFEDTIDYSNIETLNIDENLNYLVMSSPMTLPSLKTINVSTNNPYLYIKDNILFYKGTNDVCLVPSTLEEVTIDWEVVEEADFKNCKNLKKVTFTNKVKEIKYDAFTGCESLETIIFEEGSNLKIIEEYAFSECHSLKEIVIPNSLEKIGRGVLYNCVNLEKVTIPFMGEYRYTKYESSNPNYLAYIFGPGYNFDHLNANKLKEVHITEQQIIQNVSFYNCPAEKIIIEGTNLLEGAYLGNQAFFGCKNLKELVIPEGITEIKENCFKNCLNLETIYLPTSLKLIKTNAFAGCEALKEVNYEGNLLENIEIESGNECLTALFLFFVKRKTLTSKKCLHLIFFKHII